MLFVRNIIQRIFNMCKSNLVIGFNKLRSLMSQENNPQEQEQLTSEEL